MTSHYSYNRPKPFATNFAYLDPKAKITLELAAKQHRVSNQPIGDQYDMKFEKGAYPAAGNPDVPYISAKNVGGQFRYNVKYRQ